MFSVLKHAGGSVSSSNKLKCTLTKIEVQIVYFLYTKSIQILYYIGCVYIFSIHQAKIHFAISHLMYTICIHQGYDVYLLYTSVLC